MNCCKGEELDELTLTQTNEINKELDRKKKELRNTFKLLLLGAGESGKSTIAKQMKLIHLNGFTSDEKKLYVKAIHNNIVSSIAILIEAAQNFEYKIRVSKSIYDKFTDTANLKNIELSPEVAKDVAKLWKDSAIQKAYDRRSEYQLIDSAQYYLDDVERLAMPDYIPSDQDLLRSRIQTTGIIETEFDYKGKKFILVDVGGQRSERKKWIHCFEDITAVLYCVGLSAFDQTLYEDNATNRLHESIKLFHEICQSKWFSGASIILFLNKSDLFAEKLRDGKSIKAAFPEYNGLDQFDDSVSYIEGKFGGVIDPVTGKEKTIFPYVTCATDTNNVRKVFEAVQQTITVDSIATAGLVQ